MTALDDIRRAARDLADLRREVAAHERALEVAIVTARATGVTESAIRAAVEAP